MLTLTLYSRSDCPLCDAMEATLRVVQGEIPFQLKKIDISTNAALHDRFSLEIPLLYINGQRAFMYDLTADELLQRLTAELEKP